MTDTVNGYIVISWWQEKSSDGATGSFEYEHFTALEDAVTTYREYESSEYERAREIAIVCARNGIPTGVRIHPRTGSPMSSGDMAERLERAAVEGIANL